MIAIDLTSHGLPSPKTVAVINPLPPLKKEQHRNALPSLKKEQRNPVTSLTSCWHRSAHRKNSAKRSPTRLLLGWEDSTGIWPRDGHPVTTSHLFWPNQRRRATLLPPNWLRNLGPAAGEILAQLLPGNQTSDFPIRARTNTSAGRRGGSHARVSQYPATGNVAWNFLNKWLPYSTRRETHGPKAQFITDPMLGGCSTGQAPI